MEGHGHGWTAAASFVAMWTAMMAAMMLPSLVPVMARSARPFVLALGYGSVWAALGAIVHPAYVHAADAPSLPIPTGLLLLFVGALQLTSWKARHLERHQAMVVAAGTAPARSAAAAWREGMKLGACCLRSCAGPTAVMLALGPMDLRVMAVVGLAVTAERLPRQGVLVARATGAAAVIAGFIALGAARA